MLLKAFLIDLYYSATHCSSSNETVLTFEGLKDIRSDCGIMRRNIYEYFYFVKEQNVALLNHHEDQS